MTKLLKNASKRVVLAAMRRLRTVPEVAQYAILAKKLNQMATAADDGAEDEYPEAGAVVRELSANTKIKLTTADYVTWMDGDGDGDMNKFDKAAIKFLGKAPYEAGKQAARLPYLLMYALGVGPRKIGGIDMQKLLPKGFKRTVDTAATDKQLPELKAHPFYAKFAAALKAAGWTAKSPDTFVKKVRKDTVALTLSVTPEQNKIGSTISWETDGGGGGLYDGNAADIKGNLDDIKAVV